MPRRAYRSPNREYALAIQRRSVIDAAGTLGQTQDEFVNGLAEHYKSQLRRVIDAAREPGTTTDRGPGDPAATWQRIADDPWQVLEYRQDLYELWFDDTLRDLETWLAASPDAQAMIDRAALRPFIGARGVNARRPVWRAFADAARALQVLAPLTGGVSASALEAGLPAIEIAAGIADAFGGVSKLVVGSSMRMGRDHSLEFLDLRKDPRAFAAATEELRALLEVATGTRATAPTYEPEGTRAAIADELRRGAEAFVVFHELAHLLLPNREDPHEEEERCDAFATHVLLASRRGLIVLGISMALMVLAAVFRDEGRFIVSETHPRFGRRMDGIWQLLTNAGAQPPDDWDALLAVPCRVMEEAVFRTETRQRLAPNVAIALHDGWKDAPQGEHSSPVAEAMLNDGVRIPTLDEDTRRTWWQYEGFRVMLLVVELPTAVAAAERALRAAAPDAPWNVHDAACDAVLRLLAFLGHEPPPPAGAAALFASIARRAPTRTASTEAASPRTWAYLEQIGAVHRAGRRARVRPLVGLEFTVPWQWY